METQTETENKKFGAGGTPGGIGVLLLGFALACAGAWLLTDQVVVSGDYFGSGFMLPIVNHRMNSFGLSLIPFIIGIGFLFFDGKSLRRMAAYDRRPGDHFSGDPDEPAHLFPPHLAVQHSGHAGAAFWRPWSNLPLVKIHAPDTG